MVEERKILYLRISEEKVHMVRCMHECGLGYKAICKLLDLPRSTVRYIVLYKRRPYVHVNSRGRTPIPEKV